MGPAKFEIGDKVTFKDGDGTIYRVTKIGGEDVDGQMEWKYWIRDEITNQENWAYGWVLRMVVRFVGWDQEDI